jgi:tricorn protease
VGRGGKYLYFLASTNFALNTGWLDMSSYDRPSTRALYLMVLARGAVAAAAGVRRRGHGADTRRPVLRVRWRLTRAAAPRTGAATSRAAVPDVVIDFDGIMQRVISLGVGPRLLAAPAGAGRHDLLQTSRARRGKPRRQGGATLHRYRLEDREASSFVSGVQRVHVSGDRSEAAVPLAARTGRSRTRNGAGGADRHECGPDQRRP